MAQTSQTKIKCYIMTSKGGVNACYEYVAPETPCRHPNALKDARINITFHPVGLCEPDINPLLYSVKKSPKC